MKSKSTGKKANTVTKKKRLLWLVRTGVQIIAFLLAPSLFSQAFSAVKEIFTAIGKGSTLSVTGFTVRLLVLCGATIVLGRIFCGWICAFGAVNDWIYSVSAFLQKKAGKKLPKLPGVMISVLQKGKYLVLFAILLFCFLGQGAKISERSPWTVFSMITAGNFDFSLSKYGVAIFLLIFLVTGMAFHERFFCQFFCPMGAVFSLLPELPFTALHRNGKNCIPNCQACRANCPMHIKLGEDSLKQGECVRCGRCMVTCPGKNIRIFRFRSRQEERERKEA